MKKLLTILVLSFLLFSCKEECKIKQFYTYKEIDTLKKPIVEYFSTIYPENHDQNQDNDSCGCE